VIDAHPEIGQWVVAGHSLGGAMAASFIAGDPEQVEGLALWASFPAGGSPLTDRTELAVSSISGSLDGLATPADIEASRSLLPPQTEFVEIQGGNHAQFGWYGAQNGDNPATITREEQQAQTVAATLRTLAAACAP
jgi:dienelactone hydrolase